MPSHHLDFDNVFTESAPFVWRVLARLGVAQSDIQDVCQEVFLVIYKKLDEFDGRPARAWIYGISVRAAADYRKRAFRRREVIGEPPFEPSVAAEQHHELELGRARQRLDRVLDGLDEDKRQVFVLYELEELPMSEVADIVACPLQTAYSRLHAARRAVRSAFSTPSERGGAG